MGAERQFGEASTGRRTRRKWDWAKERADVITNPPRSKAKLSATNDGSLTWFSREVEGTGENLRKIFEAFCGFRREVCANAWNPLSLYPRKSAQSMAVSVAAIKSDEKNETGSLESEGTSQIQSQKKITTTAFVARIVEYRWRYLLTFVQVSSVVTERRSKRSDSNDK